MIQVRVRIRNHLLLLAACVLVPGLIGATIAIQTVRDDARETALRGLRETVRATALLVDGQLQRSIGALSALGHSSALARGDFEAFYAEAQAANMPPDVWTLLLDESGTQRLNTAVPFGTPPPPPTARERVAATLASGQPLVTDVLVGPVTGKLITTVYLPAAPVSGAATRYVVAQAFAVEHWKKSALQPQGRADWVVAVIDRNGHFIARSLRTDELLGQTARPELVAAAASAPEGLIRHRTLEGVEVYDAFAYSRLTGWTVAVAAPVDSIEASVTEAAVPLTAGLLVALIGGAISLTWLAHALFNGVQGASLAAQALGEGRQPDPATSSLDELDALHRSIADAGRLLASERDRREAAESSRRGLLESEQAARELAQRQNASKDVFLAMLGHELRNPLAAIAGATARLERSRLGVEERRFLDIMQRQNDHLARIVDDLLDSSRMLSGKLMLKARPFDLGECVRRGVEALRAAPQASGHELAVEASSAWIDGDSVRIEQVLNNLVTNAIKFSPPGSRIRVVVRAHAGAAILEVSDSGSGIAAELLPHIYEPFIQGPSPAGQAPSGLGLGLALVQQIVALHGGTVEATSHAPAAGCTFRVTLRRIAAPAAVPAASPTPLGEACRVLLVEDNADIRAAVAAVLLDEGFEVIEAADGEGALVIAPACDPDVVVMDLGLPGKSGLVVAAELRGWAALHGVALIALSGYGQQSDSDESRRAGFVAHLVKPTSPDELIRVIGLHRRRRPTATAEP